MIYVLFFFIFIFFMNRAMLRVRINTDSENLQREINNKILQNRKLDTLYGREPKTPKQEIERAILDIRKSKNKIH